MCYGDGAIPPASGLNLGVAGSGDVVLTASDGNRFAAHTARTAATTGRGMVILPDARGLHVFYKELARRFAEAGIGAVAIDYFGRTAGVAGSDADRSDSFDYKPHLEAATREGVTADAAAAAAYLRSPEGGSATSVFTIGFCFGGAMSWAQSALGDGYAGCIGLYGVPGRVEDLVPEMAAPLLVLAAGADFTPVSAVEAFAAAVAEAGGSAPVITYPDAPHSFFDRRSADWQDACADVWRRTLDFVDAHSRLPATRGVDAGTP